MNTLDNTHGFFCDAAGNELLGSDGMFRIDGRLGVARRDMLAAKRRAAFRRHMLPKWERMTHYKWRGQVRPVPSL